MNIQLFVQDEALRQEVKNRLTKSLDRIVLDRAYQGIPTDGADVAKLAINQAFAELVKEYQIKEEPRFSSEAR